MNATLTPAQLAMAASLPDDVLDALCDSRVIRAAADALGRTEHELAALAGAMLRAAGTAASAGSACPPAFCCVVRYRCATCYCPAHTPAGA